jgi:flagellar hook-associated protein 3 FlgL
MRTTAVSTPSLLNAPRTAVHRMQAEMTRLSKEMTTGRMSDIGLTFGAATGRNVTLHVDLDSLAAAVNSLGGAATRLEHTQLALDEMRTNADAFLDKVIAALEPGASMQIIHDAAQSGLSQFIANANASDGHTYLFGGINAGVPPIADYAAGPKAAVDAAFLAKFGFTQDDPLAAGISASDLADFIDNEFAALFADPDWGTTWSVASDETMATRVSATETIDTSISANSPAMRKLAMVYTMVADLGIEGLGADAQKALLNRAASLAGEGVNDVVDLQTSAGANQNRLKETTDRLTLEQDITKRRLSALEGVDPAEAKVHFDALSTEIEMSYSLTAKLLQISLLNYA